MNLRTFRAQGGGVVVWMYTHDKVRLSLGTYTCSGCGHTSRPVEWSSANGHALTCCQIPSEEA